MHQAFKSILKYMASKPAFLPYPKEMINAQILL